MKLTGLQILNPLYDDKQYITAPPKKSEKVIGGGERFVWEDECLDAFFTKANILFNTYNSLVAPMGSGKSATQSASCILDIVGTDYGRKQLIVAPQTHIGRGFFEDSGEVTNYFIRGKSYKVQVNADHNFCEESSVAELKKWILAKPSTLAKLCNPKKGFIDGLIATTTNAALAQAFIELYEEHPTLRKKIFANTHLHLDESQHVRLSSLNSTDEDDANRLGIILEHLHKNNDGTSAVTFSTATDWRGDRCRVIPDDLRGQFNSYIRTEDTHFGTLGTKSFQLEFIQFSKLPFKKLFDVIKNEKGEYHLIVVPPRNRGWRARFTESSNWGMDFLLAGLKKIWSGVRINNLVFEEDRRGEKAAVLNEPKCPEAGEPVFDAVCTCLIREGLDWCPCSRLHVTYAEGSTVLAIQTLGRVTRRFRAGKTAVPWLKKRYAKDGKGKTSIIIRRYLPTLPKPKPNTGMTAADALEDFKNVQLVLMQVDGMYRPIIFPQDGKPQKKSTGCGGKYWSLADLLKEDYFPLLDEFCEMMLELDASDASAEDVEVGIIALLGKYHVPIAYVEKATTALKATYARRLPKYAGVDIAWVRAGGFKKMWKRCDGRLTCAYGTADRKALKQIIETHFNTMVKDAHKFIKKASDWDEYPALKAWAIKMKKEMGLA